MAMTESTMLELGTSAPDFDLLSTDDTNVKLSDFAGADALVVTFICNHCPYVLHIAPALAALATKYQQKNVRFVAINSNDTEAYPADSFDAMKHEKELRGYPFPYLLDDTQSVAKAYGAACTPDIYVFNSEKKLAYRGQFDNSRPYRIASGNYDDRDGAATGDSLASAIDAVLSGNAIPAPQKPSIGCNIKWCPGNEPKYY